MGDEHESWQTIGAHRFRVEPPDVFVLHDFGDVSPDEMRALCDVVHRIADEAGRAIFWINDISRMGELPAETRKIAALSGVLSRARAVAVVGAGFRQRILARLVVSAARLSMRAGSLPPIEFFPDEQEARDWIARLRRVA